ncbi:dienelactone hydrolase family protein [Leifsonia sp. McL0607]|uniref:dienelactone hydrolase family protein n=1 Tax=Leifsonia sp. McL0607 TaxID=3415672 RepID=UPI003CE778FF
MNFFSDDSTADGVRRRGFLVDDVPGVLWTTPTPVPGAPLILSGHGGGLHKEAPGLVARAHRFVLDLGYTVAAIDAPGHGDRPRSARDQQWVDALLGARDRGEPLDPVIAEYNGSLAERSVPEWRATLDALQQLDELGAGPVGYTGMTLASAIGIPLAAAEPRIRAASFGGIGAHRFMLEAAREVAIPLEFLFPLDDPEITRASQLELFDAFASTEKVLLGFPGSHFRVPADRLDTRLFPRTFG